MNRLTLSWRLGLSFGVLILLMCVLGSLAVWRINLAATSASEMSIKRAPEVQAAHDMDTAAWKTRFNIRGYALTGDEEYLRKGRRFLSTLKGHLKAAKDLATKFPDLVALNKGGMEAMEKTTEFEALVDQLEAEYKNVAAQEVALDANAKTFMQSCLGLRISQEQQVNAELDEKADPAKVKEQVVKMGLVEGLIDSGNAIRIAKFKAQAAGDVDAQRDVLTHFTPRRNRKSPEITGLLCTF